MTVVRAAIAERERLLGEARRRASSERTSFRVWAVFDKDEHDVEAALRLAKQAHIDVAFSNPCFELWPLLHLVDYGSQDDRHAVQRRLEHQMPNYRHDKGAIIDFDLIKGNLAEGIQRAERLLNAREAEGCPGGAPSTSVCVLVKKILENGNIAARKAATKL